MGRFKTSLDLFKGSLTVIAQDKSLLFFPVIALLFIFIIILLFISPFVLSNTGHTLTDPLHWKALGDQIISLAENKDMKPGAIGYAWFAVIYLISIFSATFFNAAFYNEIIHALNGNGVSIIRGIRAALSKIKLILIWSMFAGIVGIIIKTLAERLGFVGQWLLRLIGIAWSVAIIFIIPVILREEKSSSPLKLLKTSALLLKKTWGEAVIGFLGIGFSFLFVLLVFIPFFIIIMIVIGQMMVNLWQVFTVLFFMAICLFTFACLCSLTRHIYCCALYVYASEGVVPGPFDEEMMNRAWKVKAVRKG